MTLVNKQVVLKAAYDEEWQTESLKEVIEGFEKQHQGVIVELILEANLREKLLSGEIQADLVQIYNGDIHSYRKRGIVADLTPWIERSGLNVNERFHTGIFNLCRTADGIAGIPISATTKGVFYNKRWFRQAQIPFPADNWTWNDFLDISLQLAKTRGLAEGEYAVRIPFHWEYLWSIVKSFDGSFFSPDGKAEGCLNGRTTVEAIQWVLDLIHKHKVSPQTNGYFDTSAFQNNQIGMIFEYYIPLHYLEAEMGENIGIAPIPSWDSDKPAEQIPWLCGFGLSTGSSQPELAWSLLEALTLKSNPLTGVVTEGFIAPLKQTYTDVGHDMNHNRNFILQQCNLMNNTLFTPTSSEFHHLDSMFSPIFNKLLEEGGEVQALLNDLARQWDESHR